MRRDAEVVATGRFPLPVSQAAHAVIRDMITRMTRGDAGRRHGRRAVLAACGISAVGVLSGCGIQLEHGAATSPSPTPSSPPPDPLAVPVRRLRRLAEAAAQVHSTADRTTSPTSGATSTGPTGVADATDFAHLVARLHLRQVKALQPRTGATHRPTPRSRPTPAERLTPERLAALESRGVDRDAIAALTRSDKEHLPVLACLAAFQGAVGVHLGATPDWPDTYVPGAAVARRLLTNVRPCVYALETCAARAPLHARGDFNAALQVLYAARSDLVAAAGDTLTPPSPDYRLPIQPTSPAARRRLARTMLNRVVTAAASQAPHAAGDEATAGFVIRLWCQTTAEAWHLGVTPVPFPGLDA